LFPFSSIIVSIAATIVASLLKIFEAVITFVAGSKTKNFVRATFVANFATSVAKFKTSVARTAIKVDNPLRMIELVGTRVFAFPQAVGVAVMKIKSFGLRVAKRTFCF
jgi:hypothetical protein